MDREARRTSQPARSVIIASVLAVAFVIYLWATSTSSKEPFAHRVRAHSLTMNLRISLKAHAK